MTDTAPAAFLSADDLAHLTGRRMKSKQIEWLRKEGIAFHINAVGQPVVLWSALEGSKAAAQAQAASSAWVPRILGQGV